MSTVTAPTGSLHHFHVRKDDALHSNSPQSSILHYPIEALVQHFHIPCPPDIGQLNPDRVAAYTAHLHEIEARINAEIAAAREILVEFVGREVADEDAALIRTAANLIPREIDPLRVIDIVGLDVQAEGNQRVQK